MRKSSQEPKSNIAEDYLHRYLHVGFALKNKCNLAVKGRGLSGQNELISPTCVNREKSLKDSVMTF